MDENIFIPVKLLNELRRSATEQLEEALVAPMQRKAPEKKLYRTSGESSHSGDNSSFLLFASCETEEQFNVLKNIPEIHGLYLPADLMETAISTELFQKKDLYPGISSCYKRKCTICTSDPVYGLDFYWQNQRLSGP